MIIRELISSVRSFNRLLSTDNLLSDRAIYAELKANALLLIKRETNLRKLWATDTLFTTIPCLELQQVPIAECCDYTDDCTIARTKFRLPRIAEGNYQYLIQGVYSINAMGGKGTKLKEISINRYLNLLKLPLIKKEHYFWISDDFLYCTNSEVQKIRISALFEQDIPNTILYPEGCTPDTLCQNPLDKQFFLPGYLSQQCLALTQQKLMQSYYRLKSDLSVNNLDGQSVNVNEVGK